MTADRKINRRQPPFLQRPPTPAAVIDMPLQLAVCLLALILIGTTALADPGRIYTKPDTTAPGGIEGSTGIELTHAVAIDHERSHVYRAELSDSGRKFLFSHLPVGKYDLVLLAKNRVVYEGLILGDAPMTFPIAVLENLKKRVAVADTFFNRHIIHRTGFEGDRALVFVERIRDKLILKQSGEKLGGNLRRFEIIELEQAADDWQMVSTRHIYREEEPLESSPPFFEHFQVSELGNIRVVDSVKQLGLIPLPKP